MRSLASAEGQLLASNAWVSLTICGVGFFGFDLGAPGRRRNREYEGDDGFNSPGQTAQDVDGLVFLQPPSTGFFGGHRANGFIGFCSVRICVLALFCWILDRLPELTVATALRRERLKVPISLGGSFSSNATNLGLPCGILGFAVPDLRGIRGQGVGFLSHDQRRSHRFD